MRGLFAKIIPFLFLGIMVVIFFVGLFLLSQLLIFGALVGLVLFVIAKIRELFQKPQDRKLPVRKIRPGRTIDHDDL